MEQKQVQNIDSIYCTKFSDARTIIPNTKKRKRCTYLYIQYCSKLPI
jgi:hypothetical protein